MWMILRKSLLWGLIAAFMLPFPFVQRAIAGGESAEVAKRALCETQMSVCEERFGRSDTCDTGYQHCIDKGAFPMPDMLLDPIEDDGCEKQMRECLDPDWEPLSTHSDGTPVQGD